MTISFVVMQLQGADDDRLFGRLKTELEEENEMNKGKRFLALLMVAVMTLSGVNLPAMTVSAAEQSDVIASASDATPGDATPGDATPGDATPCVPEHECEFTVEVVEKAPTCGEDGIKRLYCAYGDGKYETAVIDKVEHLYGKYIETKAPTCTEDGAETAWCVYCGKAQDTRAVSKIPHKFTKYDEVTKAPTCTEAGKVTAYCDYGCGASDTKDDPAHKALGHEFVTTITKKAGKGIVGEKTTTCKRKGCTYSKKGEKIAAVKRVSLSGSSCTYTGKAIKPAVTLYDTDGKKVSSDNYTVTYKNNTNVGIATATVTFKGAAYEGSCSVTYRILPKASSVSTVTQVSGGIKVTWSKAGGAAAYYLYRSTDGKKYTKIATVTATSYVDKTANVNGRKYIYKVTAYKKVRENGSVSVYSAAGRNTGSTYYVSAPTISKLANNTPGIAKVTYSKNTKATGYQVQYATGRTMNGAKTYSISGSKNVNMNIPKMVKGKTYYIRVRSTKTVNGVTYYSQWSSIGTIKITK